VLSLLKRSWRSAFAGLVVVAASGSPAFGQDGGIDRPTKGWAYTQLFGGVGGTGSTAVQQQGVAFFPDSAGGALSVNAAGTAASQTLGMGGVTFGYQFSERCGALGRSWGIRPAAEFEVFYLGVTRDAVLPAPSPRLPEHNFVDKFPTNSAVFLANVVFNIRTPWERVSPYVGFGIGTTYQSISGADSLQTAPPEAGVNHFNSIPHATDWGFTTQLKAGVRFDLTDRVWIFSEYRLLTVDSTQFTFGSTQYATHPPTTPWNVNFGRTNQNMVVAGVGLRF
jgi:opacity protein-like surface antigen